MPRKGEEEGWPAEGAKRKKGCVKTGQKSLRLASPAPEHRIANRIRREIATLGAL